MNIDSTRPHVGRIYDYILGGHHNFEVDRVAAEQVLKLVPAYPELARQNRGFLQLAAMRCARDKVSRILDLASALPTQGHFNEHLPDADILFSDNDPLSVRHGREILQGQSNHRYIEADLLDPDPLFDAAAQFLGRGHHMVIGFIGVSYLLPDSAVHRLARLGHELSGPGSAMASTRRSSASKAIPRWISNSMGCSPCDNVPRIGAA